MGRVAGLFYLSLIANGITTYLVVGAGLFDKKNAALTAENILNNEFLFRLGFVTELLMLVSFLGLGLILYQLYQGTGKALARAMLVVIGVSCAAMSLNTVHYMAALWLLNPADYLVIFTMEQRQTAALFLLNLHSFGYTASQIYFGLWLFPLGMLVFRGEYFPNYWRQFVGVCLMLGCFSYLIDFFVLVLAPNMHPSIPGWVAIPPDIGEFGLCLSLLFFGRKKFKQTQKLAPFSADTIS